MKITMIDQRSRIKKIDHRNIPENLTNLKNLLTQYTRPTADTVAAKMMLWNLQKLKLTKKTM